jgi:hypothetical protein
MVSGSTLSVHGDKDVNRPAANTMTNVSGDNPACEAEILSTSESPSGWRSSPSVVATQVHQRWCPKPINGCSLQYPFAFHIIRITLGLELKPETPM